MAAVVTIAPPPASAELNDTFYSFFYQSPDVERLDITATGGDSQITVSWPSATRYTGPKSVLYLVDVQSPGGYSSQSLVGRGGCTVTTSPSSAGRQSCVISGLENSRTYYVHLTAAAIDEAVYGDRPLRIGGDMGTPAVVTLCCTQVAPVTQVRITDNGEGRGTVSWAVPQDTGGSTDLRYDVTVTPGTKSCSTSDTSCLVTGLKPNTSYTATVTASNRSFTSTPATSPAVRVPPESPRAPTRVKARLKGAKAILTWRPPANADAASVTQYVVRSTPRGLSCTARRQTTCTVTGLKPGVPYTFEVRATGGATSGAFSKPTPRVTRPLPEVARPAPAVPTPSIPEKPPAVIT